MSELDEILQKKLEALEQGQPLEQVLKDLPQEGRDLAPLIRLVSDLRSLPHPQPHSSEVPTRRRLEAASAQMPARRVRRRVEWPLGHLGLMPRISWATLAILFAVVAIFSLGMWLLGPRDAQAATLMDVRGEALVASEGSEDWVPVLDGDQVHAGQRLITGNNASVTLVFYEGSRLTLGSNTYIALSELKGGLGNALRVVITQHAGRTQHSVVPLRGAKSTYQVVTPAGIASVHGTRFSVLVGRGGAARFAVSSGKVAVSSQESQVFLEAGQATAALPGELPQSPAYTFTLQGQVESIEGDTWVVNGVSFRVTSETQVFDDPQVGSLVLVEGRIVDGERVADSVSVIESGEPESTLTGVLEEMEDDRWQVDGATICVDQNTQLDSGLEVGMAVKVTFTVSEDGCWLALKIESLQEEPPTPEPGVTETITATETVTPSETPTPSATITPTVTVTPTVTLTPTETITPTVTLTPTVFVNCTGANPHPTGQTLAQRYGVPYEEIMGWFCQGFGFGEIDLAYGLSRTYGIPVEEIFALRRSGLGWGQIKRMVPSLTPVATTEPAPSETEPSPSETAEPPQATPTPVPKNNRACPGDTTYSSAVSLAAKYGVSYEEIVSWFCQGFGFGEIDKAYGLSLQTSTPVAQIFAMRASGMGWGQIEAQLMSKPGKHGKP